MGKISRHLFSLSLDEVRYDVRGFRGGENPKVREHVETVGVSFLHGFHAALENDAIPDLVAELETVDHGYQGFAYEGAAMSLYLLDQLVPMRRRFRAFLDDKGGDHVYMVYVGAGWAMARLPFGLRRGLARMPPLMRWLAMDGYGFHQGFFHWPTTVEGPRVVPRRVRGYARRAFDQGVGRSLWFVDGHDVERIPRTIAGFPSDRHPDLWAGIGLAAVYAGGVDRQALESLRRAAGPYRSQLAQGATFGAEARRRAGNLEPHNDLGTEVLCDGMSAVEAADLTQEAVADLENRPEDGPVPLFEIWRRRLQEPFRASASTSEAAA